MSDYDKGFNDYLAGVAGDENGSDEYLEGWYDAMDWSGR